MGKNPKMHPTQLAMNFLMEDGWMAKLSSMIASAGFLWYFVSKYLEPFHLDADLSRLVSKLISYFYPYIEIKFPEQSGEKLKRNEAYTTIEQYLGTINTTFARRFKAEFIKDQKKLDLSLDDKEEVIDSFKGIRFWWSSNYVPIKNTQISFYPSSDFKRNYCLKFHRRDNDLVQNEYLNHVMETGKEASIKKRIRKLHTNNRDDHGYFKERLWIHVPFEHPATFDTIAMDPKMKQEIIDDLLTFCGNKDYYKRIGKAWKRGYLLYGPPGTGKSSMVAAMANLLDYDIYDLELTAVKNNSMLRKLLIDTSSKSIIVIEDIDCSSTLTKKRKVKKKKGEEEDEKDKLLGKKEEDLESKVTLSGLLNFIDGLWSSCGSERLIVFTTNHVKKLDPALIRRGRMDKHIELSYCRFEAFKVLAYNYLDINNHPLFTEVENLMAEVKITPADVAENLIPKRRIDKEEDATICLKNLIQALIDCKANPIVDDPEPDEDDDGDEDVEKKEEGTIKKEDEVRDQNKE